MHGGGPHAGNRPQIVKQALCILGLGLCAVMPSGAALFAAEGEISAAELRALMDQNRRLQEQVQSQQQQIDELRGRLNELAGTGTRQARELDELRDRVAETAAGPVARSSGGDRDRELRLSGEAGLAYFNGGPQSAWPNREFRADDVKVYLEAPIWKDTYLFAELDLVTREVNDEFFHMGEVYVDFENLSGRLGGPDRLLNLRVGRVDIPFGEEYLFRGVLDNPLITHSVADIWGVDEGVELYGTAGRLSYVFAVQNGGHKTLRDFNREKAYTLRVGADPAGWLHASASAMRTGNLTIAGDFLSEVWIGGGFFRSIGPAATTKCFEATLYQADVRAHWEGGHLAAAVGQAEYDDDDTAANNQRKLKHFYVEAAQQIAGGLYAAARYSELSVAKGYLLQGLGNGGTFFYNGLPLTENLKRLSLGVGYRFGDPLLLKVEFAQEDGRMMNGQARDKEDLFATEIVVKF
jgi:hypothetical protein